MDAEPNAEDQAIVDEAMNVASEVSGHLAKFRIDLAIDAVYHFTWDRFAAEILEESKPLLKGEDAVRANSRALVLYQTLVCVLKTLHPFMPFVTEEIWQSLPKKDADFLMVAKWPGA
jgi:valyl-tRNA synthetase